MIQRDDYTLPMPAEPSVSRPDPRELDRAVATLRAGGVVGMPTETVYGLAGDALNPAAVARIFETKARPRFDPLIVHVTGLDAARALTTALPDAALVLAREFWPGPLTLVLPKRDLVPDITTSGLPAVALRVPSHPVALALLDAFGGPLAAPSANRFGSISPTTSQHVRREFGDAVPIVLEGGPCETGVESTIVSFADGDPLLLRPGGLPIELIEARIGPVRRPAPGEKRVLAPGMLERHYAPRTPMRLAATLDDAVALALAASGRAGLLALGPVADASSFATVEMLSHAGDLREAAAALFAAMRRLDAAGLDLIVAQRVPDEGLGLAINDRLRRASAPA